MEEELQKLTELKTQQKLLFKAVKGWRAQNAIYRMIERDDIYDVIKGYKLEEMKRMTEIIQRYSESKDKITDEEKKMLKEYIQQISGVYNFELP